MQHLTEEQLVLHHYHDDESPAPIEQHIGSCDECRGEFEKLRSVLALVDELPIPDRGDHYAEQVWNRLHWKLDRKRRRTWQTALAAAAVLAIAFFAGQLWHARNTALRPESTSTSASVVPGVQTASPANRDRVLVVVVSSHLEDSERMLLEVANADTSHSLDLSGDSRRAAELVANNRMYRQTAVRKGDARIASLLADIEPILVELSHADTLPPEKLVSLQKRIDAKGLLFKVRLVSAENDGGDSPQTSHPQKGSNSL